MQNFMISGQGKIFYDYPTHDHGYWEVLLNLKGHGTAFIGKQRYEFEPGTIFCIRPGVKHSKSAVDGFMDASILIGDFCFNSLPGDVHIFHDDEQHSFEHLYMAARDFPYNPDTDHYAEFYLNHIIDAMQNLLAHWRSQTYINPVIQEFRKMLSEHVSDFHFNMEEAISKQSYSPNHFRKLFKDSCGCTPTQYLNQLKIQKAKELLIQHKSIMTINEIAQSCGFEDPYYFSRVFKQISGASPMKFYKDNQRLDTNNLGSDYIL